MCAWFVIEKVRRPPGCWKPLLIARYADPQGAIRACIRVLIPTLRSGDFHRQRERLQIQDIAGKRVYHSSTSLLTGVMTEGIANTGGASIMSR